MHRMFVQYSNCTGVLRCNVSWGVEVVPAESSAGRKHAFRPAAPLPELQMKRAVCEHGAWSRWDTQLPRMLIGGVVSTWNKKVFRPAEYDTGLPSTGYHPRSQQSCYTNMLAVYINNLENWVGVQCRCMLSVSLFSQQQPISKGSNWKLLISANVFLLNIPNLLQVNGINHSWALGPVPRFITWIHTCNQGATKVPQWTSSVSRQCIVNSGWSVAAFHVTRFWAKDIVLYKGFST